MGNTYSVLNSMNEVHYATSGKTMVNLGTEAVEIAPVNGDHAFGVPSLHLVTSYENRVPPGLNIPYVLLFKEVVSVKAIFMFVLMGSSKIISTPLSMYPEREGIQGCFLLPSSHQVLYIPAHG
jgi:hypothetical protein